jgi:hypothetical protein
VATDRYVSRCDACGRFAQYPRDFDYDAICIRCIDDPRPAIQAKVKEVRRWWYGHVRFPTLHGDLL